MRTAFRDFIKIVISFLPLQALIRGYEAYTLFSQQTVPPQIASLEWMGYGLDNLVFLVFAFAVLPIYAVLCRSWRRTAIITAFVLFYIYIITSLCLTVYFTITLVPLDQVIFFYTGHEIIQIVKATLRFELLGTLVFIVLVSLPVLLYRLMRRMETGGFFLIAGGLLLLMSPVAVYFVTPRQQDFRDDFSYYLRSNKTGYALQRLAEYRLSRSQSAGQGKGGGRVWKGPGPDPLSIKRFHSAEPGFTYLDDHYPLLRIDNTADHLSGYFSFRKERPNIVLIIVESLSPSFCGSNPFYGHLMTFLDSLRMKSLYWQDCFATSERTFNVLAATLASVPYSNGIYFENEDRIPRYFSLMRYLKENGYFTSFMYGGDPEFSAYSHFIRHQGADYFLKFYGNKYDRDDLSRENGYVWGYPDGDLFQRSLDAIDSMNINPRLDVYLTLSTHSPFSPPHPEVYMKMLDQRMKELKLNSLQRNMILKQKNIFSSVVYLDHSLQQFFARYSKRPDFSNTIFIITGDHSMGEIHTTYLCPVEKYHVPLIIYSPMLKKPAVSHSVASHLDITPTVLAMLKNSFGIRIRSSAHWLGKGLEIIPTFRSERKLSFIYNNRSQKDYLDGTSFITSGRLFRLLPGARLVSVENEALKARLEQEQNDYLSVTDSLRKPNSIVPDALYYSGNYRVEPYPWNKPAVYRKERTNDEFISLLPGHEMKGDLLFLRMRLRVNIEPADGDTAVMPRVTVVVYNHKVDKMYAYLAYKLKHVVSEGKNYYELDDFADLSTCPVRIQKYLNIYLWNLKKRTFVLDDLRFNCEAYDINRPQR